MAIEMIRTGRKIEFLKVGIGNPFYAHNGIWIRISYDAAKRLGPSDMHTSCCSFTIDECDEFVEFVNIVVDGVPMLPPENIERVLEPLEKPVPPPEQYIVKGIRIPGLKPLQ